MPIYQYRCENVKCRPFERIRSVNICGASAICQECGGIAGQTLTVPARIAMGTGTTRRDSGYNRTEV